MIEELGHAIETHLFSGIDTPGDEGQLFRHWVTQETSTASHRTDTETTSNNTQALTDSPQPEGATDTQAAIDRSSEIHPLSAPADDSGLIVVDGAPIAIETAALNSFNWSRSLDFSKAINLNFNELVGLPSTGLQIPPGQTRREIFNIDNIIGAGYKNLPVLGFAGLSADIDAAIGYDFGMKLDLGKANAGISGGAYIAIGGFLPEPGSGLQGNLNFNLDIKPIILDWGLTTPSFKAWAYLFYEAGLNLDWYYDLPLPGWAKKGLSWLGIPASDRGHILEPDSFRIADTIGKKIGFNAQSFGGKIDLSSGLNLGGSISTPSPAKPSPAWASTIFPNVDLKLFSPPLPKPKVSQNSIQLSRDFPF